MPSTHFQYGSERIEVKKKVHRVVKASATAPSAWSPITRETYRRFHAWRRDRSRFYGQPNYTPRFETFEAFGVLEKQGPTYKSVGFPYTFSGKVENIKIFEVTVEPVIKDGEVFDYKGLLAPNEKTGVLEPIRKITQDEETPKRQDVLFNADVLFPPMVGPSDDHFSVERMSAAHMAQPMKSVAITEGELDAMAFNEQAGFLALSVLNASAGKEIDPRILEILKYQDVVWLATDWDKPGGECQRRLLKTLTEANVKAKVLGQLGRCKDACEFIGRYGSKKFADTIRQAMTTREVIEVIETKTAAAKIDDMPAAVLDGVLGQLCRERLGSFPIAYSWPALVTTASVFAKTLSANARVNLYTSQVGPTGSGKSQVCEHALRLFDEIVPRLVRDKVGSAEGLAKRIGAVGQEQRLWFPGELKHTLSKAKIANASFPSVLNDLYYQDESDLIIAEQKSLKFSCRLSIMGGVVADEFGEVFDAATVGGLYDRFIFGLCPDAQRQWEYREFEGGPAEWAAPPVNVAIPLEVWREKARWCREENWVSRIAEHAIRVAAICASFDGRGMLCVDDLGPAFEFAKYQHQTRLLLKPNPGQTNEGKLIDSMRAYLERHSPNREWVSISKMFNDTNTYKIGVTTAQRIISVFEFNHEWETREVGSQKHRQIRKL